MILIIVFDGLRPEQINTDNTPNLNRLIRNGVTFLNHHPVFPTHTRVNVASMYTGCYPYKHGLVANAMIYPNIDPQWIVNSGNHEDLQKLDELTDGNLLWEKGLGEILSETGKKMCAIGVGTSGNAFLHHHKAEALGGVLIHPQFTLPASEGFVIRERFGEWPDRSIPNSDRIKRGVDILLEYLIPVHRPDVASVWISDPDSTQHVKGVGSPEALESINKADEQLGRIIDYLESTGLSKTTDILIPSDHGYSTITDVVDVGRLLVEAGLKEAGDSNDILVASNGGCELLYLPKQDLGKLEAVVAFLMEQTWCGPIFTRDGEGHVAGTFPLSKIHNDCDRSPDILFSFAWDALENTHGMRGRAASSGSYASTGAGNHGSISPYEMNNILIASGPHFKRAVQNNVPSGNVDLFPTVLHLLGVKSPNEVDGRVLFEALINGPEPKEIFVETVISRQGRSTKYLDFNQELQVSYVDATEYVDKARAYKRVK